MVAKCIVLGYSPSTKDTTMKRYIMIRAGEDKSKRSFSFVQLAVNSAIFILNVYYIFGLEVKK